MQPQTNVERHTKISVAAILLPLAAVLLAAGIACAFSERSFSLGAQSLTAAALCLAAEVLLAIPVLTFLFPGTAAVVSLVACGGFGALCAGLPGAVAGTAALLCIAVLSFCQSDLGVTPFLWIPAAVAAYGLAYLAVGSFASASLALFPFLPAVFLGHAQADGAPRAETAIRTAVGVFASVVGVACLAAYLTVGTLSLSDITARIDAWRQPMTELLLQYGGNLVDAEAAESVVSSMFNLIPGAALALLETAGFCIAVFSRGLRTAYAHRSHAEHEPQAAVRYFDRYRFSFVSGGLYVAAGIFSLFAGDSFEGAVSANLSLVLFPAMLLSGICYWIDVYRFRRPGHRLPIVPIALCIFSVVLYGAAAPAVLCEMLAISGAISVLFRPLRERREAYFRNHPDQDPRNGNGNGDGTGGN